MADTAPEPKGGAQQPKGDAEEEPKEAIPVPQPTAEPRGLSMSLADIVKSRCANAAGPETITVACMMPCSSAARGTLKRPLCLLTLLVPS